jgi:hypothetical protein
MMHLENVLQDVDLLHGLGSNITIIAVDNSKNALIRRFKSRILYNVAEIKLSTNVEVPRNSQLVFPTDMGLGTEVTPEHIILWTGKE